MRHLVMAVVLAAVCSACAADVAPDAGAEAPTGTSEQAVETACLEACMDVWDRLNVICRTLPQYKRQACWIAANGVLATCIANCPD